MTSKVYDTAHEVIRDAGLVGKNVELHRFTTHYPPEEGGGSIDFSAIYFKGKEQNCCERDREPEMISSWNARHRSAGSSTVPSESTKAYVGLILEECRKAKSVISDVNKKHYNHRAGVRFLGEVIEKMEAFRCDIEASIESDVETIEDIIVEGIDKIIQALEMYMSDEKSGVYAQYIIYSQGATIGFLCNTIWG